MFYCLFPYGIIDRIIKNIPVGNGMGIRWVRVRTLLGGHSKLTCACNGGGGSNFFHFGAYVLIE